MNDEIIERLLRNAPAVAVPAGLFERLEMQIRLHAAPARAAQADWRPWLRRWLPAFSVAAFLAACALAVAVQTGALSSLQRQNTELRAAAASLDELRAQNAEHKQLAARIAQLEQLRADNAELQRLRGEIATLQAGLQEATKLAAENQNLRTQLGAAAGGGTGADDFFAQAKGRADRIRCVNNLKQIGLAARIWAGDNNEILPPDFLSMTNELSTPAVLQCPTGGEPAWTNWAEVAAGNTSYRLLVPGIRGDADPRTVLATCPVHHNYLMIDGSVQQLSPDDEKNYLKTVDGRLIFDRQ